MPISYYPRIGTSKISGTLKGTVGAAWFILFLIVGYYFRHPPTGTARPSEELGITPCNLLSRSDGDTGPNRDRTLVIMAKAFAIMTSVRSRGPSTAVCLAGCSGTPKVDVGGHRWMPKIIAHDKGEMNRAAVGALQRTADLEIQCADDN